MYRVPLLLAAMTGFLLMLGLGVLFPVLPFYVRSLNLSELQGGLLMSAYAAVAVIVGPLWGRFSERRGRKPAIIIGLLGFALGFLLFSMATTFAGLLAARVLGGLFAAAAMPAIFALVADLSEPEKRSSAMGVLGAAVGIGVVAGPAIGGLVATIDLVWPFRLSAAIGTIAAMLVAAFVREPPRRAPAEGDTPARTRALAGRLRPLLAYSLVLSTARTGFEATLGFFVADRFGGSPRHVGMFLGAIGLLGVGVQGGGIRWLSRRVRDERVVVFGTALAALAFVGYALASDWRMFGAAGAAFALGLALATPTFTAVLSRRGEGAQGPTQGLNHSAQSMGRVLGPVALTFVYQHGGGTVCYLACCGLMLLADAMVAVEFARAPEALATSTARS